MKSRVGIRGDRFGSRLILIGITIAVLFWVFDAILDDVVFHEVEFPKSLIGVSFMEIWMRLLVFALIVGFSIYSKKLVVERRRAEEALEKANENLDKKVRERTGELARANETLRESEERFRTIYEAARHGLFVIDMDGRYRDVNGAACRLFGYTREELLKADIREPFFPEKTAAELQGLLKGWAEGGPVADASLRNKEGAEVFVKINTAAFHMRRERFVLAVVSDITESRRAEEERVRLQAQLIQAQKMEAVGTLAGGIAHDFNNILAVIKNLTFLALREAEGNSRMKEYIEPIRDVSERATGLVNQLLIFSRKRGFEPVSLDLNAAVCELLNMLESLVSEDILVEKDFEDGLWNIKADRGRVEQVITNLVVNGRDAMPRGGRIVLRTRNVVFAPDLPSARAGTGQGEGGGPGDFVCLTVEDTGTGMDKETLGHIFEPFFTTKSPEGTGLGLSVVYGIVKELKGWIDVSSVPGEGSRFDIYFPVSMEPEEAVAEKPAGKTVVGRGERILLVEDEEWVRKTTAMVLAESGYVVSEAESAEDAIGIFRKEKGRFDLVLSDVVMPGSSGLAMTPSLLDINPGIPILFFSGYLDDKTRIGEIIKNGFTYIQKPYELPDLLQAVEKAICGGT